MGISISGTSSSIYPSSTTSEGTSSTGSSSSTSSSTGSSSGTSSSTGSSSGTSSSTSTSSTSTPTTTSTIESSNDTEFLERQKAEELTEASIASAAKIADARISKSNQNVANVSGGIHHPQSHAPSSPIKSQLIATNGV